MKDVEEEISNLKRLFGRDHEQRLISLLFTFKHRNQYHLVFPWADANLAQFWERFYSAADPPRDRDLACWVARELLGLAQGLYAIHEPDEVAESGSNQEYGRHGDLKPENILWFRVQGSSNRGATSLFTAGKLKIADFGLCDFHSNGTKSKVPANNIGVTHTYRAPESVTKCCVSPRYDFWSLGCVILLFVTWYAEGWQGIDDFSERRKKESPPCIVRGVPVLRDTFFNWNKLYGEAAMNKAVEEVRQARLISQQN